MKTWTQQEADHGRSHEDMNKMQPQSDTVAATTTILATNEQSVVISAQPLPIEVTHGSLNQIIDVERATRNLPAEETQTTASVNLRGELDLGNDKLETEVQAVVHSKRTGQALPPQMPTYRAQWASTIVSQPLLTPVEPPTLQAMEPPTSIVQLPDSSVSSPIEPTNVSASGQVMQSSPKSVQQTQGAVQEQSNDVVDLTEETLTEPRQSTRIRETLRIARQRNHFIER